MVLKFLHFHIFSLICKFQFYYEVFREHSAKYVKIWVISGWYFPTEGNNLRLCPYTGKYGSWRTNILT